MAYTIDSRANVQLPQGFEGFYGFNGGGKEQMCLLLFCCFCKDNSASPFTDGRFAALKKDHSNPQAVAGDHIKAFHQNMLAK